MVDIPGNTTSTATVVGNPTTGATFSGELDSFGDIDYIRVTLTAGVTYRFYGSAEGAGVGVGNSHLRLRNAVGTELAGNDDDPAGGTQNSAFTFTPSASGTYFLDIRSASGLAGLYSIAVTAVAGTDNRLSDLDDVQGATANQRVIGDEGDDVITLGANSHALGEQGDDQILGGVSANFISGGLGNDTINGGGGADNLFGDAGLDFINGGSGDDNIWGGDGADNIVDIGGGLDTIRGGEGGDYIEAGTDNDTIYGDGGDDLLYGQEGNDTLTGGLGQDTLTGGLGNDTYVLEDGSDTVNDSGGLDTVTSTINRSMAVGGLTAVENLVLVNAATALNASGNALNNVISGNNFNNVLDGNTGNDTLFGGIGDDTLIGSVGDDTLVGGAGRDAMTGGANNDIFRFLVLSDSTVANPDIIADFDDSGDDLIDVSALFGPALTFRGPAPFNAAGQLRINDIAGPDLLVEVNVDANLAADFAIRLTNTVVGSMTQTDFIL